jgi:hypothetical protein
MNPQFGQCGCGFFVVKLWQKVTQNGGKTVEITLVLWHSGTVLPRFSRVKILGSWWG